MAYNIAEIGKKVKLLREAASFTQQQLAEQMGMSKATISQYESQERVPSPVSIVKISCMSIIANLIECRWIKV